MKSFLCYLFSRNRKAYLEIAKKNGCSAFRVYKLAHGAKARNSAEYEVIRSLIRKGIVSGYRLG